MVHKTQMIPILLFGLSLIAIYSISRDMQITTNLPTSSKKSSTSKKKSSHATSSSDKLKTISRELESEQNPKKVIVVTRIHKGSANSMPDHKKVLEFVENVKSYSNSVLICVSIAFLMLYA